MRPLIPTDRTPQPHVRLEELERRDTPAFVQLPPFTTGLAAPTVIAVGDFNRDGRADVAVGNQGVGSAGVSSVSILLGNGDGSFTAAPALTDPLLAVPQSIVIADFNGDGIPDLAVGSTASAQPDVGSTLVFLGKGDGTFGAPTFRQPVPAIALGAGDFTGDGVPDLLVVGPPGLIFSVYRGIGDGTFSPITSQQFAPLSVNRVVVADFNGDGLLDFAGLDVMSTGSRIVTLYGKGDGTFNPPVFTPLAGTPSDLVAGDFDGDGKVDLVVAEDTAAVLHKNLGGQAAFDAAGVPVLTAGQTINRLAAADFDRNGLPDVVAVAGPEVDVATSLGGGTFAADSGNPYTTPGTWAGADVATGDADGDGNQDIVVVRRSADGTADLGRVLLNLALDATKTTLSATPNPSGEDQPVRLAATVTPSVPPLSTGPVPTGTVTFLSDGTTLGTVPLTNGTATLLVAGFAAGTHSLVAQYSGDAAYRPSTSPPVAQVVTQGGSVLRYEVTGLPQGPGLGAERVASGLFTPDGIPDIVLGSGAGLPAQVTVIDGQTRQVVAQVQPFGDFTGGVFVAAGDLDGDGVADLVVAADQGGGPRVRAYLTRGTQLVPAADFFALDPDFRGGLRIALGDVNHDGVPDLVVTGGPGAGPRVAIYDGRSLLPGMSPTHLVNDFFVLDPTYRGGLFVAAGDVSGDGYAELVIGADAGGGPRVQVFDGASILAGAPATLADFFSGPATDRGGVRVAVRDVDGDGYPEVFTGSGPGSGSQVRIYNGVATVTEPNPTSFFETDAFPGLTSGVYVA